MFPYTFWGIGLYDVCIVIAMIIGYVLYFKLMDNRKVDVKSSNYFFLIVVVTSIPGFFSANLVQSFFNYVKSGVFELKGLTFYGGLVGWIISFFVVFFISGKIFLKGDKFRKVCSNFKDLFDVAPICICVGHAIGRVGCLFEGCCHGGETSSFIGIDMYVDKLGEFRKRVPTQLFETVYLLILAFALYKCYKKNFNVNFPLYFIFYGIWRFLLEYVRQDSRGQFIGSLFTPAQIISFGLITVGLTILIIKIVVRRKNKGTAI